MGAIARALGRAKATVSRELQRNALPLGGYSPLHAAGAYQLRRRREAILEERPLYVCSWGTGSPRDGRPTDSRLVEIRERTAAAGHRLRDNLRLHYRAAQKAAALWRYLTRRHKRRRPRRARASRDAIKDRASTMIVRRPLKAAARPALGGRPHHLQTHTGCARLA